MILGIIEHDRGKLNPASLEALTLARSLAQSLNAPLHAVGVGEEARALADQLQRFGVSCLHLVQHERLHDYAPEAWARSIGQLLEARKPQAVAAPGTDRGNELLAHLAAITGLPMAANCIEVRPTEPFEVTRLRWGGSLLEDAILDGHPRLFTVAPFTIEAQAAPVPQDLTLETFRPSLQEKDFRVRIARRDHAADDKISLPEARVVVGGGRGVGSAEGFALLETLAHLLDGAVGGSRVVTNLGWRPHSDQIGQTGTRIAPDLYIACGISGAIQHMVGCKGAKRILSINIDRDAPIMSKADYAVIGDLHEVLEAVVAELERKKVAA